MTVYLLVLAITFLGCSWAQKCDNRILNCGGTLAKRHSTEAKIIFTLFAAFLILISGLRFGGGDYFAYYHSYEYFANHLTDDIKTLSEPGFDIICWLAFRFSKDPAAMFVLASLITVGLSMIVIYKQTDRLLMASLLFLFLGCWHGSLNAVRQCVAAAIVFCGIGFLREKKLIKYAVLVFVAFLFHKSALIMILPFFIARNRITRQNVILLIVGSLVVLYSYSYVYNFTETILDKSLSGDMDYLSKSVNPFRVLVAIVPSIYFLIGYERDEPDSLSDFYMNLLLIHSSIMLMSSGSAYYARIGIYTAPFCCIAIPELSRRKKQKNNHVWEIVIMLFFLLYWIYDISAFHFSSVTYDFIWQR